MSRALALASTRAYQVSGRSVARSVIPDSGVARYEVEQDVTDSWDGHNGTDNTSAGYVSGKIGDYAKDFDGSGDFVEIDSVSDELTSDVFSVTFWVNTTQSSRGVFIGINASDAGNVLLIWLWDDSNGPVEIQDSVGSNVMSGSTDVDDGNWHHVVVTSDGSNLTLYVDGNGEDSGSASYTISSDDRISLGQEYDSGFSTGDFYEGAMDDIRFYDKELSSTEVSNLFNSGEI